MPKERRKIAVIDAETDPFEIGVVPKPFIWGFYDGEFYEQFDTVEELMNFLGDKEYIIYAHNGGKFDYHFLLDYLPTHENIMVINGRLAKFKIGECEFRDSFNILPAPLKAFNKDDIEYWKMKKEHREEHRKEIEEYLYKDCFYLYNTIQEYIETYGISLTFASAAMKQWENINGKVNKTSEQFYDKFKPYYYGGRVECFEHGIIKGNIHFADINSAYPFAMVHDHPCDKYFESWDFLPEDRNDIAKSMIHLKCISHGALPLRTKEGLFFPADETKREYFITGWEYLAGIDTRTIKDVEIIECHSFYQDINFTPYVNHFWELKDNAKAAGDNTQYQFAKFFLNSLYGKFAANPDHYNEYMLMHHEEIEAAGKDNWEYSNDLGKYALMQRDLPEYKKIYYNLATAASITGFVRAYLWRNIYGVDRPLYCDTDSVAFIGNHNMQLSPRLGDWEIEAECNSAAIAGKKLYSFRKLNGKYKTASKGVKLNASQIYNIAKGGVEIYHSEAPTFSIKKDVSFVDREVRKTYKEFTAKLAV